MTAQAVIDILLDRKGFDAWWDDIEPDIQQDILDELNKVIKNGNK